METQISEQSGKSGRPPLPAEKKRVPLFCKVYPSTMEFLKALGEENNGRAVDKLVTLHQRLRKAKKATS